MIAALLSYLPALALALTIEALVVAGVAPRGRRRAAVRACIALNLLTHPLGTLLAWRTDCDPLLVWLLEFLIEWIGYARLLQIPTAQALRYATLPNVLAGIAGLWFWVMGMR